MGRRTVHGKKDCAWEGGEGGLYMGRRTVQGKEVKEDCAWQGGEGGLCPSTPTVDLASQVLLGPFLSPGQVQWATGFTKRDKGLFWEVRPPGSQASP